MNKTRTIVKDCLKPNSYTDSLRYKVWCDNDYKGQGNTEIEALTVSLERLNDRFKEYYDKYYDLIKKLNNAGLILESESGCKCCN